MTVDFSDLMEPVPLRKPRTRTEKQTGSIVATVEKEVVLAMVEQMEQEAETQKQQVLGVAHSENASGWAEAIARWLAQHSGEVSWGELEVELGMPWVEIWLGLLLGGFVLEQRGEFYQRETIWVDGARK